MRYRKRRGPPMRLILGGLAALVVALTAAVFWYSHKAESNPPEQRDIRVEATNVIP